MGKGLFEAMQKREQIAQRNKYRNMEPLKFSPIPVDPADSLVKEYLMKTKYSELSHLGHWMKNRHLLNELQDDILDLSQTKEDIISLFGGFKKMIGLILQQMFNLNYMQHQQLFLLLTTLNEQYNDKYPHIKSPLISLHESCISIIYNFLNNEEHFNLQRCCSNLAIIGESKASKASKFKKHPFNSTIDTTYNIMTHFILISQNNILIKRKGLQQISESLSSIFHSNKNSTAKYAKLLVSSGYIKHITQAINMKSDDMSMAKEYKLVQSKAIHIIRELSERKSNRILLVCDGFVLKELDYFFRYNKFLKNKNIFYDIVYIMNNLLDTNPSYKDSLNIESLLQFICSNILDVAWWIKVQTLILLNKIIHSEKCNINRLVLNELIKVISILINAFGKQMDDNWRQNLEVGDTIHFQHDINDWNGSIDGAKVIIRFEPENECVVLKGEYNFHDSTKAKYIKDEINPQIMRFIDHISHETILLLACLSKKISCLYNSNKVTMNFDDDTKEQTNYFKKGDIVKIIHLKTKCWNGKMGKIVGSFSISKQRWPVQLMDDDHKLLLKSINIELVPFSDCISSLERIICGLGRFWSRFKYQHDKKKTETVRNQKDQNLENTLLDFITTNPFFMMSDSVCRFLGNYLQEDELHIFIVKKILHRVYCHKFIFKIFTQNEYIIPFFQQWLYFDPTDYNINIIVDIIKLLLPLNNMYSTLGMMQNLSRLVNGGKSMYTHDRSIKDTNSINILIDNKFWLVIKTMLQSVNLTRVDVLESLYWMLYLMNSVLVKTGNMEFRQIFIDIVCSLVKNDIFIRYIRKRLSTQETGRWLGGPGSDPNEHIWDILYYCMNIDVSLCDYMMKEQSFIVDLAISNKKGDNENALRVLLFAIHNCQQAESMDIARLVKVGLIQYLLDYIGYHRCNVMSNRARDSGEQFKFIQILNVLELLLKGRNKKLRNINVDVSMLHDIVKESKKINLDDETTNMLLSKVLLVIKLTEYPSII